MTRRTLRVAPNRLNTLVVSDPRPVAPLTLPAGVFAFDSSFIRPGISTYLADLPSVLGAHRGRRLTVFGHTDAVGSDQYNKLLSDRRARATLAILTADVDAFDEVAKEEEWGAPEHQAMLRTIGCDPGPPDGEPGEMTKAAVFAFQRGYNLGLWFETYQSQKYAALEHSGDLDSTTMAAIRDAYVNYVGLDVKLGSLAETPLAGCGEFNPQGSDADKRRVTLALFDLAPTTPFPCVAGDAPACLIDDGGTRRCKFYRDEVSEPEALERAAVFCDDHWMPTPSKWAYMSVLTSLPDETPVTFTVYRAGSSVPDGSLDSEDDELPADLEEIATVQGAVIHGVAFAVWRADETFTPFDPETWYEHAGLEALDQSFVVGGIEPAALTAWLDAGEAHTYYRPPLFKVEGGGQWLLSRAPGRRLRGLASDVPVSTPALLMDPSGRFFGGPRSRACLRPWGDCGHP